MGDDRYSFVKQAFGEETFKTICKSRILVVGAGGIGCEILKTLVLTGFEDIEIIDLDTIDASNLNRQFLFTKDDVGKPKSVVARNTAAAFNPRSKIVAHHGNIKSEEFGRSFFETFDLVISALDNLDARKHVNRVCIALDKPLVESGTRGFEGQVLPIKKGLSECFDCQTRSEQRQYAYCTIRAMPTRMVHCVAYAKVLYEHIFGFPEDDDDPTNFAQLQKDSLAAKEPVQKLAARLFNKVHNTIIVDLLDCKDTTWKTTKPVPMPLYESLDPSEAASTPKDACAVLTPSQHAHLFVSSFTRLSQRPRANFDKDDDDAVHFVSAAANLRAHIYGIKTESHFEIKAIAGNIIPAIATTNAIISGTVILDVIKLLCGRATDCRMTFCNRIPKRFQRKPCLLYPSDLLPPNPKCYICSPSRDRFLTIAVDMSKTTMGFLVSSIIQRELSFAEPVIDVATLGTVYDHEVHRGHAKLQQSLAALGIRDEMSVVLSDGVQDLEFKAVIRHKDLADANEFEVSGDMQPMAPKPEASVAASASSSKASATVDVNDDDEPVEYVPKAVRKRTAHKAGLGEESPAKAAVTKKAKQSQTSNAPSVETIELD